MTWTERDGSLVRELRTPDFITAFHLPGALVAPAEALGHHPDLALGWGYLKITLTTHDAGGVTELDRILARKLDEALNEFDLG